MGFKARFAQNAYRRLGRKIGYRRRSRFCSELAEGVGAISPLERRAITAG